MFLTDHDLKQMGSQYFSGLPFEKLLGVTLKLFEDLKEARDLLNQNPQNSSRPSGSFPLWEGKASTVEEKNNEESEIKKQKKQELKSAVEVALLDCSEEPYLRRIPNTAPRTRWRVPPCIQATPVMSTAALAYQVLFSRRDNVHEVVGSCPICSSHQVLSLGYDLFR